MKVSKAQVQANRAHIVQTASVLFRERGYDGVGIADLMAAAGFTHGGFYKHFASKAELLAEAATCGFAQGAARADEMDGLGFVKYYLSREHRDARGDGCTMAALSADAGRQPEQIKAAFASGLESMLATLASKAGEVDSAESELRAQRIVVIAQVVGALMLSRACPDDSTLADEILEACCADVLTRLYSRTKPSSVS
ncbi:TetR/AcrR family transcriptional regulator [Pseudomonas donghuensis]|uniref:TetR/AcrR family transcriptional regulator n=1 Tax=Pseudomonas donghuensis TaxID=1163398 RepID=UPI000C2AE32C|nr:TetR/AcrR family transcriptional regulator [Pseudomonas donghuensis]PJY96879.1 TetR family transcriptional regulator [Pseudomonas donghuensis]UVL31412.1 TetR/AcrR family transcriptional regulator [Pseudomonas donghuensis]WKY30439.1 helix-turn-helix domain-containing protein [Pseudomonas donghuensis]